MTGTTKKVKMDLVGLDGNAFALMGSFKREAKRQGWTQAEVDSVLEECQRGDYYHLLSTLMGATEPTASVDDEDDERPLDEDDDDFDDAEDEDEDED